MLQIRVDVSRGPVYFFESKEPHKIEEYRDDFGLKFREVYNPLGYLLTVGAFGILFMLRSESLSLRTPGSIPDECVGSKGYEMAVKQMNKLGNHAGVLVYMNPQGVAWVSDRKGKHDLKRSYPYPYLFEEGKVLMS